MGSVLQTIANAVARKLIDPRAARQETLSLRDAASEGRSALQAVRGPNNELYYFPTSTDRSDRAAWEPLRQAVQRGMYVEKGRMPTRKASDADRLSRKVIEGGFPRNKVIDPEMDIVSVKMDDPGRRAQAVAGWGETIDPRSAFLHDLAADPKAKGAGYALMKQSMEGPMLPEAERILFTPLGGARNFYREKFGAELLTPEEAFSDPALRDIIGKLGQHENVGDLGLGIVHRQQGGSVEANRNKDTRFQLENDREQQESARRKAEQAAKDRANGVLSEQCRKLKEDQMKPRNGHIPLLPQNCLKRGGLASLRKQHA